jgi:hypothetical protein
LKYGRPEPVVAAAPALETPRTAATVVAVVHI